MTGSHEVTGSIPVGSTKKNVAAGDGATDSAESGGDDSRGADSRSADSRSAEGGRFAAVDLKGLVDRHTTIQSPALVPEIRLHLAAELTPVWEATEARTGQAEPPPFWAFAWVGGQALARYVLDHPELVRNRCVLDFATGGGIVGIAAAMAGAQRVIATDLDPRALAAAAKNADLNGVTLELREEDWVGQRPPVDVLLSGDICYERSVAARLTRWFSDLAQDGLPVFIGDGGRAFLPQRGLIVLHRASVATTREIESQPQREATVYRVSDAGCE